MSDNIALELELLEHEQTHRLNRARSGLLNFTVHTFPEYQVNWHHRRLCQYLNRFANGEIKRLMVFLPPRTGKSTLVSRHLPAYLLGKNPKTNVISASYSADLASRMNRDVQRIIDSPAYGELFPDVKLSGKGTEGVWSRNSDIFEIVKHGGVYRSSGVGGGITGMGMFYGLLDDPIKNQQEADSLVFRDRLWEWYTTTFYTRLEKNGCICVTTTRWHEDDLAGRLLKQARENPQADQWTVVTFPMLCETPSIDDPRQVDEPLWPEKFDYDALLTMRATLGSRTWNAMHQQRPAPEKGMIVNREWWRFYETLPENLEVMIEAWDLAFTKSDKSDFVVGVVLGKKGADIYLLDIIRDRLSFTQSLAAVKNLSRKWPQAEAKYVERAANGFALIDTLRAEVPGLIAVPPLGSKVARANAVSPRIESGNVWLPHPSIAPWVNDVIEEWVAFPAGTNDDIVDAMSHGIAKLMEMKATDWLPISIVGQNKWK